MCVFYQQYSNINSFLLKVLFFGIEKFHDNKSCTVTLSYALNLYALCICFRTEKGFNSS